MAREKHVRPAGGRCLIDFEVDSVVMVPAVLLQSDHTESSKNAELSMIFEDHVSDPT